MNKDYNGLQNIQIVIAFSLFLKIEKWDKNKPQSFKFYCKICKQNCLTIPKKSKKY